jgi:hypothetical protein
MVLLNRLQVVEGKTPDAHDKDDDKIDKKEVGKVEATNCCMGCDKKFKWLEKTTKDSEDSKKSVGNAHEKIGHLNESAIRCNLRSNKREEAHRNISSLQQLVKCYGESQGEKWTETDTFESCKRVVEHLKTENTEYEFSKWYYEQAKNHQGLAPGLVKKIQSFSLLQQEGEMDYSVVKFYKSGKLNNYISGPISNWENYIEPSGPIFLLALYQSVKGLNKLLSFPPPGVLTMDDPVKIWRARSIVYIEVGEIKSSDEGKVLKNAKLQLQRSLLCFKWLDIILSRPTIFIYGLVGNIFINGNCSSTQKKYETKPQGDLKKDEILIKYKYNLYK